MNKRIIGLILAGLICVGGQVTQSYANENLKQEVKVKARQSKIQNGWVKDEYGDWSYYKNGEMLKETWLKDNGKWYYFDYVGLMISNGSYYIDNKDYIFDKSGAMIEKKGWIRIVDVYDSGIDEFWFWGNGDGTVAVGEWIKDNGKWYYIDNYGYMVSNTSLYIEEDEKRYVFSSNGSLIEKKGWILLKDYDGENYWYWGNGDGTVKTEQWIKDNGKWYYAGEYGELVHSGVIEIGNKPYLFNTNGAMIEKKGWINFKAYNGNFYWSYGNGDGTIKTEQWIKDNGKWYYVDYYGEMLKDQSSYIDGKEYIFDSNGVCVNP